MKFRLALFHNFNRIKMMKTLLIFCFVPCGLLAQTYFPFPDSNAVWHVYNEGIENYNQYFHYVMEEGDTVMNGQAYNKVFLYYSFDTVVVGIREDSLKRVFFYGNPAHVTDGDKLDSVGEYLLYQFGLNIGDTIPLYKVTQNDSPRVILSIDSVFVDGSYRKRYSVSSSDLFWTDYWIEGIGSRAGLLGPYAYEFENRWELYCFEQNGEFIYPDSNCLSTSVESTINKNEEILIFPNPAISQIKVELVNFSCALQSVSLFNITGREMISINPTSNVVTFDIKSFPSGLYFCRILASTGSSITRKIIVE